jgi:hypothetical protein
MAGQLGVALRARRRAASEVGRRHGGVRRPFLFRSGRWLRPGSSWPLRGACASPWQRPRCRACGRRRGSPSCRSARPCARRRRPGSARAGSARGRRTGRAAWTSGGWAPGRARRDGNGCWLRGRRGSRRPFRRPRRRRPPKTCWRGRSGCRLRRPPGRRRPVRAGSAAGRSPRRRHRSVRAPRSRGPRPRSCPRFPGGPGLRARGAGNAELGREADFLQALARGGSGGCRCCRATGYRPGRRGLPVVQGA